MGKYRIILLRDQDYQRNHQGEARKDATWDDRPPVLHRPAGNVDEAQGTHGQKTHPPHVAADRASSQKQPACQEEQHDPANSQNLVFHFSLLITLSFRFDFVFIGYLRF